MALESWITPEEASLLAEAATAMIEQRLSRLTPDERSAYWASVRKAYNTPYNPPEPKALAGKVVDITLGACVANEALIPSLVAAADRPEIRAA